MCGDGKMVNKKKRIKIKNPGEINKKKWFGNWKIYEKNENIQSFFFIKAKKFTALGLPNKKYFI